MRCSPRRALAWSCGLLGTALLLIWGESDYERLVQRLEVSKQHTLPAPSPVPAAKAKGVPQASKAARPPTLLRSPVSGSRGENAIVSGPCAALATAFPAPASLAWETLTSGPATPGVLRPGMVPVVVYVYSRPEYFDQALLTLTQSLRNAGSSAPIIISHDGLHKGMEEVVVRAHRLYPAIFQIVHPPVLCLESQSPFDKGEGPPPVLAVKRHWFWMMQRIWSLLPQQYKGPVLFLEEDHVSSPDAIFALQAMIASKRCGADCFGYCLGSRSLRSKLGSDGGSKRTELRQTWGFHNTGYAMRDRAVWERIKAQEDFFWAQGYGWDWAIWRLMQRDAPVKGSETDNVAGAAQPAAYGLPRQMLYPALSRIHNVGLKGGATVDGDNDMAALITGIPFATNIAGILAAAKTTQEFTIGSQEGEIDGRDPLQLLSFSGQDHYDCLRFQDGAFGTSKSQLDC